MALLQGITNFFSKPAKTGEGGPTPNAQRMGDYNEMGVINYYGDQYPLALEGSYFVATNPTPGTGIALTTSLTTYASTAVAPFLLVQNNGQLNLELDYLKVIQTAGQLPTTATNIQIAISLDQLATKYTSGGSLITPVNVSVAPPGGGNTSGAVIHAGAVVAVTDTTLVRLLYHAYMEPIVTATPAAVAGDFFGVKFGGLEHNVGTNGAVQLAAGTPLNVKYITDQGPPIVVAPGWAASVKIFGSALAAAPTYEFELGYRER